MPELTPRAMAYRLRRMQRAVQDRVAKEEERVARQALRRAQDLSGGRFSTADLARGGWHPFAAQRYSAPQLDPAIIN